ncbi:hypothetical protein ACX3YG_24800 [Pseudomonas wadenswilerensis]
MSISQKHISLYLASVLGAEARVEKAPDLKIPFHLKDTYGIAELTLLIGDQPLSMLLMMPVDDEYPGAITLRKHLEQIEKATDKTIVFVYKSLSAPERRSLIGNQLNFIQPGSQMFIPELAMDLREQVRKRRDDKAVSTLLPAAQAMLLGCLYEGWNSERLYSSTAIMGDFRYSRVTLAKVIAQLLKLRIIQEAQSRGFTHFYSFDASPAEVFRTARRWMRSPVKRRVAIDRKLHLGDGIFLAGESALAKYTLLAGPTQPVYGMTRNTFDLLLEGKDFKVADSVDDTRAWVEIWAYRSLKANDKIADEASLLLSLEDHPDERIQIALDELREEVTWLKSED